MTETVIATQGLTKRFGKVAALAPLDLEIGRGEIVGVLGPAGAGKTVLIRLLAGLVRPTEGTVAIGGDPASSLAARRRLGVVLQGARLHGWMKGREVLAFAADLAAVPRARLDARVDAVAARLALGSVLQRRVDAMSASERGWLSIAAALVGEPEGLLLDGPFEWLDPDTRSEVLGVLSGLRGHTTVVMAGQLVADIEALCERVIVLDAGAVALDTSVEAFARRVPATFVIETGVEGGLAHAGLLARLRGEPWVRGVEATAGTIRVTVADAGRAERELLPAVIATGLPVAKLRREHPAIDQVVAGLRR